MTINCIITIIIIASHTNNNEEDIPDSTHVRTDHISNKLSSYIFGDFIIIMIKKTHFDKNDKDNNTHSYNILDFAKPIKTREDLLSFISIVFMSIFVCIIICMYMHRGQFGQEEMMTIILHLVKSLLGQKGLEYFDR